MKDRRYQKKVSKKVLIDTVKLFREYGYTVTDKSGKTIKGKDIIKRNKAGWRGNCQLNLPVSYVILSF